MAYGISISYRALLIQFNTVLGNNTVLGLKVLIKRMAGLAVFNQKTTGALAQRGLL